MALPGLKALIKDRIAELNLQVTQATQAFEEDTGLNIIGISLQRMRAYEACGHANWRKCWICKQYDSPKELTISGNDIYHKSCATERARIKRRGQHEAAKTQSV